MFIMFNPSRRTLKPAPHESPSRQTLKLYPHETSPSTTLNTLETLGEDRVKSILANFSCEVNKDVEYFLRQKAVEFAKQGLSETQLVYYKDWSYVKI